MAVDPTNVRLWSDADVYIAPIGTAIPADASTAFSGSWTMVGVLDGADGFTSSRSETVTEHYGWGGMLLKTSRKDFKLTRKFSVLEDNAQTRALIWPGSTTGVIIVPVPAKVMVAFETRDSEGRLHRVITRSYAQIDVGSDMVEDETNLTKVQLVATIFPDVNKVLFDEQTKATVTSIAITPLTLAISLSGLLYSKLTATATYSDATTGDVSSQVLWSSATPAKATVDTGGYVKGIATGTSSVSCTFHGITSTAPCVVTVGA